MTHHPAIFKDKAVVRVSSCALHPKYQAKREPRPLRGYEARVDAFSDVKCTCQEIWRAVQA